MPNFRTSARLANTVLRNSGQRLLYSTLKITPKKYGNAILVLDTLCNSSCGMCSSWSVRTPPNTLTALQWRHVIDKLYAHNKNIKISFVGGEPLMVDGILPLLEYCHLKGVIFSLVSNGTLLDSETALAVLRTEPLAFHISLDSLKPAVYKRIRGLDALADVLANVKTLKELAETMNSKTHLGLKTTINEFNVDEVIDLADYSESLGMGIHYQPVLADNKVAKRMMKVNGAALDAHADHLVDGISDGSYAKIANAPAQIRSWRRYFAEQETSRSHCPTSLENLFVMADGQVRLCERYKQTVGNIHRQEIREILESDEAKALMAETYTCKRNCSFIYKRGIRDHWRIFRIMRPKTAGS